MKSLTAPTGKTILVVDDNEAIARIIERRLKSDPGTSAIPIILVTAKGDDEDTERGHREGASAYITKPFSAAQIVEAVRTVLRKR